MSNLSLPLEARARIVTGKLATICRAAEVAEPGSKVQPREIAEYIRDEVMALPTDARPTLDSAIEAELNALYTGARAALGES